ncbi:MAG: hypothetical protein DWP92_05960 [Armatimonadetes bacterium]|nr:MAG: hypothetical protein DWP92_05960 [Armatimonadota bacterium]
MNVMCSAVHVALDTVGTSAVTGPLAVHVERCDTCDHAVRSLQEVTVALRSLDPETYTAPRELEPDVMNALGPVAVPDPDHGMSLKVPVAAAVVATAAAGTAVLIRYRRTRAA